MLADIMGINRSDIMGGNEAEMVHGRMASLPQVHHIPSCRWK